MLGESRKRKRRHGGDDDDDDERDSAKVAVSAKHLDRAGPALGIRTAFGYPQPRSNSVNAVAFLAVKPPSATVFHVFTRKDQQQEGNDEFATTQTLITAETEAVEFISTNQDKDLNNIDYSCQYASLQTPSS